jgi:NADH dehydrogenase
VADGGDGTVDAALAAGFTRVPVRAQGPVGKPVDTAFALRDGVAVVEMASASGLALLTRLAPLTASSSGTGEVVRAALDHGVERFVYVSYSGNIEGDDPLTRAKRAVERSIRESGMSYAILRPTYFMEFWLSPALGFDYPNTRATIYGSGERGISWISLGDVAEFAVRSLDEAAPRNESIELGGPEAVSPLEVVRMFEDAAGTRFEVQHVPEATLVAQRDAAADSLHEAFAALMLSYAKGDEIPMDETLRRYPVQLTAVRDYAKRALASLTTSH